MRKLLVTLVVVVGVLGGACDPPEESGGRRPGGRLGPADLELIGLVTEDSCAGLLDWLKEKAVAGLDRSGGYWFGGDELRAMPMNAGGDATAVAAPSGDGDVAAGAQQESRAPVAGEDYSATNIQEEGVDEPDIVKTDGRRLVAVAGSHVRFVDVSGPQPALRASLPLPGVQTLLLAGDRILAFGIVPGGDVPRPVPLDERAGATADAIAPVPGFRQATRVTVIDIGDIARPAVVSTLDLDGAYTAARLTGGVARVVLRSAPDKLIQRFTYPRANGDEAAKEAIERNRKTIEESRIDDWLPGYRYEEPGRPDVAADGRIAECGQVHHPREFTGVSMVTVVSVDPDDPRPGNGATVAGAGETVYASAERLWVSSARWWMGSEQPAEITTELHGFDITDKVTTRYAGSGSVTGTLLNQFSLSDHRGVLRVATTRQDPTGGQTESQVVALRFDGDKLGVVGSVGGLGKTERIYAVRFLGDLAYVVTFRQTDPLYVIDLSNPERPELKGELKIPGYSAYLHPIGDGRLLGVGQDATDEGRRLGTQLSLFDVRDPSSPKRVATHDLQSGSSMAEYDHHAFLWWPKEQLVVVPVDGGSVCGRFECTRPSYRAGAAGVVLDGDAFAPRGLISHPTGMPIARSLVVGDRLLTMSDSGLLTSDLASLTDRAWTAF